MDDSEITTCFMPITFPNHAELACMVSIYISTSPMFPSQHYVHCDLLVFVYFCQFCYITGKEQPLVQHTQYKAVH